ncbi:hypothetical protein [Streptomyces sp. NPDC001537]
MIRSRVIDLVPVLLDGPRPLGAVGEFVETGAQQGDLAPELRHIPGLDVEVAARQDRQEAGTR